MKEKLSRALVIIAIFSYGCWIMPKEVEFLAVVGILVINLALDESLAWFKAWINRSRG